MTVKMYFIIFLLLMSCDYKNDAIGPYNRVIVFGNTNVYEMSIDSIKKYLGDTRELPKEEARFEFEYRSIKDFKKFSQYRNIMFLISEESPNEYNDLIGALLSEAAKKSAEQNKSNFFLTKDLYATDQSVLLLIGNKDKDLKELIGPQSKTLVTFDNFKKSVDERYAENVLFGYNLVKASSESMMKQHGYALEQSKYYKAFENKTGVDSNIVSYFASAPLRYYWVKYFDNVQDKSINGYLDLRDKAHKMHFEGDIIDRENKIYTDSIIVGNYRFLKIQSTYITFDDGIIIGGGPCITYILQDGNRTYLLDASVYKPGSNKSIELIQLEIILKTFKLRESANDG